MGRGLKEIKGAITAVNAPTWAAHRSLWVMWVKENDQWVAVTSRDERKISDYYQLLSTRRAAQSLNVNVQTTTLSAEKVKMAEYAYGVLSNHQPEASEPRELLTAVDHYVHYKPRLKTPSVSQCCDLFMEKQVKRQLSPLTLKDYRRLLKEFRTDFDGRHIGELTSSDITRFIEKKDHPVVQRSRFIYLQTFLLFCSGKRNPHCNDTPWITSRIIQWEAPKIETHEIAVYTFGEIVELLREASRQGFLPYFIMRLFGMMRTEEYDRFVNIHPFVHDHPLISLENQRITISNAIYKKRSRQEHRGRFHNQVHPTYMAWLRHFAKNEASLKCSELLSMRIRQSITGKASARNILRHTAITYHCLAFKNPVLTAYIAGNSVGIITNHYLNMSISEGEALKLYDLSPGSRRKAGDFLEPSLGNSLSPNKSLEKYRNTGLYPQE